jgi:hypothetical protein
MEASKMKYLTPFIILLAITTTSRADMGYFGSIAQNPVPSDTLVVHPFIELTCEDVVIEVFPGGKAEITADFLFTNTGQADTVIMYFPISVMLPTHSLLWSLSDLSDPLINPSVSVNGIPTDVHPLLATNWSTWAFRDFSWVDILDTVNPLSDIEPDDHETFFYMIDTERWDSIDVILDNVLADSISDIDYLILSASSSHASWTVPFKAGEQVLVEYSMEYSLGSDYMERSYDLTYPLYTGASWSGAIGNGRITVLPRGDIGIKHFISWGSSSMPEAICEDDYSFAPLPEIVDAPGYEMTILSNLSGRHMEGALVWLFHDFEPVVSGFGWPYYFESSTDEGAIYRAEMYEDGSAGWPSSLRVIVENGGLKYL